MSAHSKRMKQTNTRPGVSRRMRILLICIAAAVLLLVGALSALVWQLVRPVQWADTLYALVPSLELLEDLRDGGSVTVGATVDTDAVARLEHPLDLSLKLDFGAEGNRAEAVVQSDTAKTNAVLSWSDEWMELSSPLLGSRVYTVDRTDPAYLADTPLAPDSGSRYAMPESLYRFVMRDPSVQKEDERVITEALMRIWKATNNRFDTKTTFGTVSLTDGAVRARAQVLTLDGDDLAAIAAAVRTEWDGHADLREAVARSLSVSEDEAQAWLYEVLDARIAEWNTRDTQIKLTVWSRRGDPVALDLLVSRAANAAAGFAEDARMRLWITTTKAPAKHAALAVQYSDWEGHRELCAARATYTRAWEQENEVIDFALQIDQKGADKHSARITAQAVCTPEERWTLSCVHETAQGFDRIEHAAYTKDLTLQAGGSLCEGEEQTELVVDRLSVELPERTLTFDRSRLCLTLNAQNPHVHATSTAFPLRGISEERLTTIEQTLQDRLEQSLNALTHALGVAPVHYGAVPVVAGKLELSGSRLTYDYKKAQILVLRTDGRITVLDAKALATVSEFKTAFAPTKAAVLEACNGRVACVHTDGSYLMYDTKTGNLLAQGTLEGTVQQAAFDGTYLIYVVNSRLYRHDLQQDHKQPLGDYTYTIPTLEWDRTARIVRVTDRDLFGNPKYVGCYETETGATASWRLPSRTIGERSNEKYRLEKVIRVDGAITVTLEVNRETGARSYFFYRNGEQGIPYASIPAARPVGMEVQENGVYLLMEGVDGREAVVLTRYSWERKWSVDLALLMELLVPYLG